jgi:hypothetical protein
MGTRRPPRPGDLLRLASVTPSCVPLRAPRGERRYRCSDLVGSPQRRWRAGDVSTRSTTNLFYTPRAQDPMASDNV